MKQSILLSLFLLFIGNFVIAQPGSNDPTFNSTDFGFGQGDGANNIVSASALQSDGKIIIGGSFTSYNATATNRIARLNSDGTFDSTFNIGSGFDNNVRSITLQSDGKIVVGGLFTSFNGTSINRIARLNSDGTLDLTFNPGSSANGTIWTTAVQSDGKIIIGGQFTIYNGTAINRIARLNSNGTLDATFNIGTGSSSDVWSIAFQTDGKIIIGGAFGLFNGVSINRIARLNTDGTLDPSFNPGSGANNIIFSTAVQNDGKIIIGGVFTIYNGTTINRVARLNSDGSIDLTFDPGTGTDNSVWEITIQNDGKIILGGVFTTFNGIAQSMITRINSDGTIDASFNIGTGANSVIYSCLIQSDGKVIISGAFITYNGTPASRVARINSDGTFDPTFNLATAANNTILTSAIQSDGKIIIGGLFTSYNGSIMNRISRLNSDGSIDATFNIGTGANNSVYATALQSDGKIIIAGALMNYNGITRNRIARLNTDGTLDLTFNPGAGANWDIRTISIQSDGKIIIGGDFTSYYGIPTNRIARLNSDGTLDATFNVGTGTSFIIYTSAIQSDGKIIIGGSFNTYNGIATNRTARLNTDGSLDATFTSGTIADGNVLTCVIQSDGKIIVGGSFTVYNGTFINRIARLNTDGTLDPTFSPVTGADNTVQTTALQSDGKIIIGGNFTSYNGSNRNYIARINSNGSYDGLFNIGTGANNSIYTTAIQSDGKIIIGGQFTAYKGIGRNRVARVFANACPVISGTTTTTNVSCFGGSNGAIILTPSGGNSPYTFNWGGSVTTKDRSGLYAGSYSVFITDVSGCLGATNATISQPTSVVSGTTTVTNVSCFGGSNGTINLTPAGGTAPYTFNWGGGITTEDRTGLTAGTYSVTITDFNGCTVTVNATVFQPTSAVTGTTVVTNVSCFGGSNGTINLTPTGGTPSYFYNWGSGITTQDRTGLTAGSYSVLIMDANSCTGTVNVTISQPNAPVSGTTVVTNVSCFGGSNGSINVTPAGGTAPYTFNWGGGITTEDRTGLTAGSYSVTITDFNGCTGTVNVTISQPTAPVSGTTTVTNVSCFGGSNGSINVTPAGGTTPYIFNWGGGITTEDRTGLTAGSYSVTITDFNGCTGTVNVTISQPTAPVSGTTTVTNVSCFGGSNGSINVTPAGGTAPYTFNWGGGITTEDRTGLTAGSYSVTITDDNGCTATVFTSVNESALIVGTSNVTACNSYTWNSTVYTATGVYTHTFTNGAVSGCDSTANLNLTINYSNASSANVTTCDTYVWLTNGTTYTTSGVYTAVLTNVNGCDSTVTLNLTINYSNSGSENVTTCDTYLWPTNGTSYTSSGVYTSLHTNVNGCDSTATLNLTINYSNSGSENVTTCDTYVWPANGTSYTSSGVYTALLTNVNGCDSTATLNLTINYSNSGSENVTTCDTYLWPTNGTSYTSSGVYTALLTNVNGCDSTATLNLTINYSNSGSENVTTCDTYVWPANGTSYTSSGVYTALLTNVNGCDSTATLNLTINSADNTITIIDDITLQANALTAQYQWLDCDNAFAPLLNEIGQQFVGSVNGNYAVEVTENGCVDTSMCYIIDKVSIKDLELKSIQIYPNPTIDMVNIDLGKVGHYSILIMDSRGRIIREFTTEDQIVLVDLKELERGVYYFKVQTENSEIIEKIIKQ